MARKAGVPPLPGTNNVYDIADQRHRKRMKEIAGTAADFYTLDDLDFSAPVEKMPWVHLDDKYMAKDWREYDGPLDIQGHHGRMIKATEALKRIDALRDKARWDRPHRRDK